MNHFDIVKLLKRISDRWYIHTALMIIGGISGFLISQITPPVYESAAVFSVTIDYTQTGALTDIQEDQAMRGVGSVILSDQVINKTLAQINNEGDFALDQSDFLENSYLDREEFRWSLRFRDPDPKNSKLIIDAWSLQANYIIQEALTHALTSSELLKTLDGLTNCLQESNIGSGHDYCGFRDLETLISSMSEISSQIQNEKAASLGLFSSLSVSFVNQGSISEQAVLGQRNLMVIGGTLIGLLTGFITALMGIIKRDQSI